MKTFSSNVALTSNLCVVGHTYTAHVVVGCGSNLSCTSSSMSGKKPRDAEDLTEGGDKKIYHIKWGHHNNSAKYRQHQSRNAESSLNQALLLNNTVAEALLKIHRSQKRQKEVCCGFVAAADSTISATKTDHFFEPKGWT